MINIAIVPLGCSKNTVDLEHMLGRLPKEDFTLAPELFGAQIVIVNTCGFIDSAKQEAIENILHLAEGRSDNPDMKIVVTGCLAERYKAQIIEQLPEVDAVVTPGKNGEIAEILRLVQSGKKGVFAGEIENLPEEGARYNLAPPNYGYIKIADGCNNRCAYCAIPLIRGRQRSRPLEAIVDEAALMVANGKRELILVAQDTTAYGLDNDAGTLSTLLRRLNALEGNFKIRIMYAYPELITEELCNAIAECEKVIHYLDMPVQHASDSVLKRMNRHGDVDTIHEAISLLVEKIPDIALRSTVMVGFPGETEEDFKELSEFVDIGYFQHLGCFSFSPEEGTAAAKMPDQVPTKKKKERLESIMHGQYLNVERIFKMRVGTTVKAFAEDICEHTNRTLLRPEFCAPEVDYYIYVDEILDLFDEYTVNITDYEGYDLIGEIASNEDN